MKPLLVQRIEKRIDDLPVADATSLAYRLRAVIIPLSTAVFLAAYSAVIAINGGGYFKRNSDGGLAPLLREYGRQYGIRVRRAVFDWRVRTYWLDDASPCAAA